MNIKTTFILVVLLAVSVLSGCTVFHTFSFPTDHTLYSAPPIDLDPFFVSHDFKKNGGQEGKYKTYGHRELVNLWTDGSTLVGEYWYKDVEIYEVFVFGCAYESEKELADRLYVWISNNINGIDYESWPTPDPYSFRFPSTVNPPLNFSLFLSNAGFEKKKSSFIKSSIEMPKNIELTLKFWSKDNIHIQETWHDGAYHVSIDDHGYGGGKSLAKELKLWIDKHFTNTTYTYDKTPTIETR